MDAPVEPPHPRLHIAVEPAEVREDDVDLFGLSPNRSNSQAVARGTLTSLARNVYPEDC
jgi:hypothetical protein